jgi:hypothetical protein
MTYITVIIVRRFGRVDCEAAQLLSEAALLFESVLSLWLRSAELIVERRGT